MKSSEQEKIIGKLSGILTLLNFQLMVNFILMIIQRKNITDTFIFIRCRCDDGYKCVLTYNLLDRHAYIFQCRENSKSENLYEFPE